MATHPPGDVGGREGSARQGVAWRAYPATAVSRRHPRHRAARSMGISINNVAVAASLPHAYVCV